MELNAEKIKRISTLVSLIIVIELIIGAATLAGVSFLLSRYDHDLKLIALTGVISIASQMMATASTILVGKSMFNNTDRAGIPSPLPQGGKFEQTSTLSVTGTEKSGTEVPVG